MSDDKAWLLAIDTATERAAIALHDGSVIVEQLWSAGRNQTSTLLREIDHLLELNGVGLDDLGAIGVARGPGSFNGLRVGMSTAKGLCFGLDVSIVGVDTLEVAALPHLGGGLPIRAFVPAGRGRAVFADYRKRNDRWVRVGDVQQQPITHLAHGLTEPTSLVGELTQEQQLELERAPLVRLPGPSLRARRAGHLAEIAFRRWKQGDVDDLTTLEPFYVHGSARP